MTRRPVSRAAAAERRLRARATLDAALGAALEDWTRALPRPATEPMDLFELNQARGERTIEMMRLAVREVA
jgi:hypothetical protein